MTKKQSGILQRAWKKHKRSITLMVLSIVVGIADSVMDWKLYTSLLETKRGLVLNPMNQQIIRNQWHMTLIGVGALVMKMFRLLIYMSSESKKVRGNLCEGFTNLPILIVYQTPKTWIQGDIARCHASTVNQVLAVITVTSFFIKLAVLIWNILKAIGMKCCTMCFEEVSKEEKKCVFVMQVLKVLTLGFILIVLSNTFMDVYCIKGSYNDCLTPGSLYDSITDTNLIGRYFSSVSLFLNFKTLKLSSESNTFNDCGWIKLLSFTREIFDNDDSLKYIDGKDIHFIINYGHVKNKSRTENVLKISRNDGTISCFIIDEISCGISLCLSNDTIDVRRIKYTIFFRYTKPVVPEQVFGDLTFNWRVTQFNMEATISESVHTNRDYRPKLHYFKELHNATSELDYMLDLPTEDEIRFYYVGGYNVHSNHSDITGSIPGWNFICNTENDIMTPHLDRFIYM